MTEDQPVLRVENLSIRLPDGAELVSNVSFEIGRGEMLALVGESGCGKSVTALGVMGLLPKHLSYGTGGQVLLKGENLIGLSDKELRSLRGDRIAMVFQNPLTALNPVLNIGTQIREQIRAHRPGLSAVALTERAIELLEMVRIPDAEMRLRDFPHRLSGGMRQRVMIAMSLACEPLLLVADEPTTALDVTVQTQILDLLAEIRARTGLAVLLITHDLGTVGAYADNVVVMYAGNMVEGGSARRVLDRPRHRYTEGLLRGRPQGNFWIARAPLIEIPGVVPGPHERGTGCRFLGRCPVARVECGQAQPAPRPDPEAPQHWACCLYPEGAT